MPVEIDRSQCIGCGMCVHFCPEYALVVSTDSFQCQGDRGLCTECLICIGYCVKGAIKEI